MLLKYHRNVNSQVHTSLALAQTGGDQSASEYQCTSPPRKLPQEINMTILSDGLHGNRLFSLRFEFQAPIRLESLHPKCGHSSGDTLIQVVGIGFSSRLHTLGHLHCKFNTSVVQGSYRGPRTIACIAPAHPAGAVDFEVTTNNQQVILHHKT